MLINAIKAIKHTTDMEKIYFEEIKNSVMGTHTYQDSVPVTYKEQIVEKNTKLVDVDSVTAMFKFGVGKTALLNFASYKYPGGCFMDGAIAQEECLCHASFLYNVLSRFPEYYEWNNKNLNRSLFTNRALCSPDIVFEQNLCTKKCDVITCAAPCKSVAKLHSRVSDEENTKALQSRIKFALDIAEVNNVDTLILGAYGAGAFGQDATEVAEIFKNTLEKHNYSFKNVIFAIPRSLNKNYEKFEEVFS